MALAAAAVDDFVVPAACENFRRMPMTLGDFVSSSAVASSTERQWHKLIVALDGFERWDDVPSELRKQVQREAECGNFEVLTRFTSATERGIEADAPSIEWSSGVGPVYRRNLRADPVTAGLIADSRLSVVDVAAKRWKKGAPAQGRPSAGDVTILRLTRMVERLHEEGSAQAVADRRSLPEQLALPPGHGRRYGRHARPKPSSSLVRAGVAGERERARVFREAEWASLRLQGRGIGDIASLASVSPSTVSESAAVRLASSLRDTALELLAVDSPNKTELAGELGLDPQRLQRAARRLDEHARGELEPPPDSDTPDPRAWDLREHALGLVHEPPTLDELATGLSSERAERYGKLLQLAADSAAGREPTMLFRREPERPRRLKAQQELTRTFGGHRHWLPSATRLGSSSERQGRPAVKNSAGPAQTQQ